MFHGIFDLFFYLFIVSSVLFSFYRGGVSFHFGLKVVMLYLFFPFPFFSPRNGFVDENTRSDRVRTELGVLGWWLMVSWGLGGGGFACIARDGCSFFCLVVAVVPRKKKLPQRIFMFLFVFIYLLGFSI